MVHLPIQSGIIANTKWYCCHLQIGDGIAANLQNSDGIFAKNPSYKLH
jgi:hypothetical protein